MAELDIDKNAPIILNQLYQFINLNGYEGKSQALIYALSQLLHEQIKILDISQEEKGSIVTGLIENFAEFNKAELALFRQQLDMFHQQKTSTIH